MEPDSLGNELKERVIRRADELRRMWQEARSTGEDEGEESAREEQGTDSTEEEKRNESTGDEKGTESDGEEKGTKSTGDEKGTESGQEKPVQQPEVINSGPKPTTKLISIGNNLFYCLSCRKETTSNHQC